MSSSSSEAQLIRRLTRIKHIILVLSGKGGVGKSSVSVQLALSLVDHHRRRRTAEDGVTEGGVRVGLLDVDLTGPSIPRMVGLNRGEVVQSRDGWVPVYLDLDPSRPPHPTSPRAGSGKGKAAEVEDEVVEKEGWGDVVECMSIGFLLKNPNDAVVWRGPKKNAMIRQFLVDVRWGELDYLVIDTPPGTSDEHISLLEHLSPLFAPRSSDSPPLPTLTSILVTTPQAVSLSDVSKELSFARKTDLKVLGLVENMSGYACPHCGEIVNVFGSGGGEEFCRKDGERVERERRARGGEEEGGGGGEEGLRFLGRVPIDVHFTRLVDHASQSTVPVPVPVTVVDGRPTTTPAASIHSHPDGSTAHSSIPDQASTARDLLERYRQTPTYSTFRSICDSVVSLVESSA